MSNWCRFRVDYRTQVVYRPILASVTFKRSQRCWNLSSTLSRWDAMPSQSDWYSTCLLWSIGGNIKVFKIHHFRIEAKHQLEYCYCSLGWRYSDVSQVTDCFFNHFRRLCLRLPVPALPIDDVHHGLAKREPIPVTNGWSKRCQFDIVSTQNSSSRHRFDIFWANHWWPIRVAFNIKKYALKNIKYIAT